MTSALSGSHEALGKWAVASFALSISSVVASAICVAVVVGCVYVDRIFLTRVSFRLSASIGIASVVSSTCRICSYHNAFMASQTGMQLRVLYWLQTAADLCTVFLVMCISLHLVLTVRMHKLYIARRLQRWYEAASTFLGLLITHPLLYMHSSVQWDAYSKLVLFDGAPLLYKKSLWPIYLAWVLLGIAFCFSASIGVVCLMKWSAPATSSKSSASTPGTVRTPSASERSGTWEELTISLQRGQTSDEMQSIALRIALYAILPLLLQPWSVACNFSSRHPTTWLYGMAYTMPSTSGLLCLLLLICNPAWDEYRTQVLQSIMRIWKPKATRANEELRLDFAKLDASTIHLSPYQSRNCSVSDDRLV